MIWKEELIYDADKHIGSFCMEVPVYADMGKWSCNVYFRQGNGSACYAAGYVRGYQV